MVKDLHGNQANMEKQLLSVTKVLNNLADNNIYKWGNPSQSTYRCWFHESNTHDTQECYSFNLLNDREKLEIARKKNLCFNCLTDQHLARN